MFPLAGSIVTLVITMREEMLSKELVGKDTCLGKAPHGTPHFKVNKSIQYMFHQLVLFHNSFREQGYWHFHIFELVKGGRQIKVFDVQAHILCTCGAEDAVPHYF
jgi:hypothetical protein